MYVSIQILNKYKNRKKKEKRVKIIQQKKEAEIYKYLKHNLALKPYIISKSTRNYNDIP